MRLKQKFKSILGEKSLGLIDHIIHPSLKNAWGGAFNGQTFRRQIFDDVCHHFNFSVMIETGSYRGNTTKLLASKKVPLITIEFSPRFYTYVATRFFINQSVKVIQGDSRKVLARLSLDNKISKENAFFYLDAHWHEDLPLAQELEIIFSNWNNAIVMIDDFQVPGTNYNFDDYGKGKALNLEYVSKVPGADKFEIFFPTVDETKESGRKRGCVILSKHQTTTEALMKCQTLRNYKFT